MTKKSKLFTPLDPLLCHKRSTNKKAICFSVQIHPRSDELIYDLPVNPW